MTKNREEFIEMRHLRYFIALAEELHFARAAERLRMEQSPLSRAIREMERILGVRLFDRNSRSTRITRAGRVFLEHAKRVVILMEQAKTSARSAALGHGDRLRVGLSDCTAYSLPLEILARFQAIHPGVSVSFHEMPLYRQIGAIRDDLLDASISLDGVCPDGIAAQVIARDSISAVLSAAHRLARSEVVSSTDLIHYPLILFNAESDLGAGRGIDNFVESLGSPRVAFRANSLGTLLTLVALGHGIGLVGSAQMSGLRRRDVVVRDITGASPSLTTYVLHSNCGVSEPLQAFIELARELLVVDSTTGPCESRDPAS